MRRQLAAVVLAVASTPCVAGAGGAPDLATSVRFAPAPLRACAAVTWRLAVRNRRGTPVSLRFRSGQLADVELRRGGRVRYRWGAARGFTQALQQRVVPARGVWRVELRDVLRVPAGRYRLVARVTGETVTGAARLAATRDVIVRGAARSCP